MSTPIRLLLVDDHAVMRSGLENMLNTHPAFQVVAGADDGETALQLFRKNLPDITLLDVSMPKMNGIECLRQIRSEFPEARVLMLSSSETETDIIQALAAGAQGYVLKTARPTELTGAILDAFAGKRVLDPTLEARIEQASEDSPLTPRELEVLHLLRRGLSNPDMGRILGISPRTAKAHVAAILEKLDVADRTEAVARAFELSLLKI